MFKVLNDLYVMIFQIRWHPDRNPNDKKKADENFKKINEVIKIHTSDDRCIFEKN